METTDTGEDRLDSEKIYPDRERRKEQSDIYFSNNLKTSVFKVIVKVKRQKMKIRQQRKKKKKTQEPEQKERGKKT